MKYQRETTKPFTAPKNCTDAALIRAYWWDVSRNPRLLFGLRDDEGQPYLLYNVLDIGSLENTPALLAG